MYGKERRLDITKSRFLKHISPVPRPFMKLNFHWSQQPNVLTVKIYLLFRKHFKMLKNALRMSKLSCVFQHFLKIIEPVQFYVKIRSHELQGTARIFLSTFASVQGLCCRDYKQLCIWVVRRSWRAVLFMYKISHKYEMSTNCVCQVYSIFAKPGSA